MRQFSIAALAAAVVGVASTASAHFPFLHFKNENGAASLHVYFAESAEPDNPALLDRLSGAEVWQVRQGSPAEPLEVKKGEVSLTTPVTVAGPTAYAFQKDYGILSRNDENFALVYYAKTFSGPDAWGIAPGGKSRFDLVPERKGEELTLTALWDGKPVADAEVVVQGGTDFVEGKTDAQGQFTCKVGGGGELYSIRGKTVEAKAGEKDGKKYDAVRHYATLTLDLK